MSEERIEIRVTVAGREHALQATSGATLREVLLANDLGPYRGVFRKWNCGGLNICGSCRVRVLENDEWWERRSCQIRCFQPMQIEIE